MKTMLKGTATALALIGMTGQALAGGACARGGEAMALKTAAIQQELMVAALYCNDVQPYNKFVVSYQRELQKSDAALLSFFVHGHGGAAAYHAYKTNLANDFSLSGLHEMTTYCHTAQTAFDAALGPDGRVTLASFVATQDVGTEGYRACDTTAAVTGESSRLASNKRD